MVNIDNIIKKSEKYLKYMPVLYALYLPLDFFIHVYQVNEGAIAPFVMNVLDLLRVFVIAAFSFYVMKTYEDYEEKIVKHPGARLMTFAGASFLEWIFNVMMSDAYVEAYSHKSFFVVFGLLTVIGFYMEFRAFYSVSKMCGNFIIFCWLGINGLLVVRCWKVYINETHDLVPLIIFMVAVRAIIRAAIIFKFAKKQAVVEDTSVEESSLEESETEDVPETVEEDFIKKLNGMLKAFVITGISLGVFLIIADKAQLVDFRGIEDDYSSKHCESLKNSDIVLPYKYYNLLSAKEGAWTEFTHFSDYKEAGKRALHPGYEYVDDRYMVLYDGVEEGYGITDGKGNWLIEPKYQSIRTDYYEKYGVLILRDYSLEKGGTAVVDRDLNYLVSGYREIDIVNEKIMVKNYDWDTHSDKCGLYDLNGNLILEPKYKKIEIRNDNLLDVTDENDSHMVLDSEGNKVDVSKIADLNADEDDEDEN
ncbi:WG repeat-containing protein [Butyrivibrio sp. LB2008]|uniref:WG repeat-containing protein n=1 Tax=Butyrivibrio sp. LB2008 TaxID=1408305 RepID=UPI00047E8809|nr:WG repeat-containing protein [Butyrivibrio sp. LB2008]